MVPPLSVVAVFCSGGIARPLVLWPRDKGSRRQATGSADPV